MVGAWPRDNGVVFGQMKVEEKVTNRSEGRHPSAGSTKGGAQRRQITAIPGLLRVVEFAGGIVIIDSMGTRKAIARELRFYLSSLAAGAGNFVFDAFALICSACRSERLAAPRCLTEDFCPVPY